MNVEFIPAFYAAFSDETAIAEIRPIIGDRIAIGKFAVCKPIKVFDFTAFSRPSRLNTIDVYSHTRYDFISQMEDEISKPILPYEKSREYIPTQIVAEYLREHFGCEGVIFRSSMHKGHDVENRNIVIFSPSEDSFDQLIELKDHSARKVSNVIFQTYDENVF
ncbi:RES family NAD+ phosphorylase [Bradyrhizobium sp. vgs-9]|uniref:RES family NAD+ phosphorylase n=1 Tax=Bradyrhizobium sp. vgs-9 TaxID=208389 RepID=UPI0035D40AC6